MVDRTGQDVIELLFEVTPDLVCLPRWGCPGTIGGTRYQGSAPEPAEVPHHGMQAYPHGDCIVLAVDPRRDPVAVGNQPGVRPGPAGSEFLPLRNREVRQQKIELFLAG